MDNKVKAGSAMTLALCAAAAIPFAACSRDLAGPNTLDNDFEAPRATVSASSWESKAARLTVSSGGFAVELGTKIYSIGGGHAHLAEPSTLQVYDPGSNAWSHGPAPANTHAWTAAEFGGRIYIFGGWDGGSYHLTTQIYDPGTDSWGTGTPIPVAHNVGGAGAIGSKIYVAAGGNSSGYVTTTHVYDPALAQWTQASAIPQPRAFVAYAVVNGKLYIIGGDNGARLATTQAYDPVTDSWTTLTAMPTARAGATAVVHDGKIYVLGGSTQEAYTNPNYTASITGVVEIYDPATDSWSTGTAMLTGRQYPQVAVSNGVLHAIAGYNGSASVADHEALQVAVLPPPPPPPPANPGNKDACYKGGWQSFGFRNQGQCVRFVETGKDSRS